MKLPTRAKQLARGAISALAQPFGTITHVDTAEPLAALTFDDGPDPEYTPALLEVLASHGARATFFMLGKRASAHPELVSRVAAAGHAVANHGWDHASFPLLSARWRRTQLRWTAEALAPHGCNLFRPPHGHQTPASQLDAWRAGYRVVTWNLVAGDWRGEDTQTLRERLERGLRPGSIALLHDSLYTTSDIAHRDREPTIRAIAQLLEKRDQALRFVTVPELLRAGRPRKWPWYPGADLGALRTQV